MSAPVRIQRQRTKGWRMPENTVYVGRGTKWGNPFIVGKTQVRMPALDGSEWEHEGRLHKRSGEQHMFVHNDNRITWHQVEDASREQCVELFAQYIGARPRTGGNYRNRAATLYRTAAIQHLRGKNLACWCPLTDAQGNHVPCHADVLLELANEAAA